MPSKEIHLTPLPIAGVSDYHCHCDYSVDAEGSIDEYCEAALQRGLAEICFTTHYDTNPKAASGDCYIRINGKNRSSKPDNLEPYVADVKNAHEKYYPLGLSVKLGIEIGWWDDCAESVEKLIARYAFDHVLCGVHEVDNLNICAPNFGQLFKNYPAAELVEKYFREVIQAARTGLFDAIAHLGYYVRFGLAHYGGQILTAHDSHLSELFAALKETNTALEINTSAIRHGLPEYYPRMAIINAAKKAGVEVSYLGSDAHKPEQIGLDFEAAVALVPATIVECED
jgi:histidinol-phosphatase (PHP family)